MTIEPFWMTASGPELNQGDWLPRCPVPTLAVSSADPTELIRTTQEDLDLCVITQTCDLANQRVRHVACVATYLLHEYEAANPSFSKKGRWNDVLKGRVEGLYLLASQTAPDDNRRAIVVDFRDIHSLPVEYLVAHATSLGSRWRLRSPYLEHFSQAFARFFMRVGLPSTIPEFR